LIKQGAISVIKNEHSTFFITIVYNIIMSNIGLTHIQATGFFIVTLLNFLFALLVWRRIRNKASFHLGLAALFSGLYSLSQSGVFYFWKISPNLQFFFWKMTWIGALIIPSFLAFFYYFSGKVKYIFIKICFWYTGATLIFFASIFTSLIIKGRPVFVPQFFSFNGTTGFLEPLARLYLLLGISVLLAELIIYFLKVKGFKRLQAKYLILGMLIYAGGSLVVSAIIPFFLKTVAFIPMVAYLSFFWIALTVYAFLKYRLMDIRVVLGKGTAYFLSLFTVVIVGVLSVFFNNRLSHPLSCFILVPTIGLLSILLFQLTKIYEKIASRYFYHTFYNAKMVIYDLEKKLAKVLNLKELSPLVAKTLKNTLKIEKIAVVLIREQEGEKKYDFQEIFGFDEKKLLLLIKSNPLESYIKEKSNKIILIKEEIYSDIVKREKADRKIDSAAYNLKKEMEKLGVEIIVRLLFENEIIGLIIIGEKISGESFTFQDLKLLESFSYRASAAFKNASLYSQIIKEKEELEKFHKVTVGRELRMIELKKQIKKLEEQLAKRSK